MATPAWVGHAHFVHPQVAIHPPPCRLRVTNNPEKNIAMNPENKGFRNTEANHLPNQRADTSGATSEGSAPARREGESRAVSGKPRGFHRPAFVITGVVLSMGLASCVVPYDSHGGSSVSVTRYSPGYRVTSLPGGYRSETISGSTYYYHDGYYYRQGSGGYVVVDAPRSSRYYDDYNNRQRTYQSGRDYRTASGRNDQQYTRTRTITHLPSGYREVNHRGNTYYQAGDRYYRRQGEGYIIVSSPY